MKSALKHLLIAWLLVQSSSVLAADLDEKGNASSTKLADDDQQPTASIAQLEQRLTEIDNQLAKLAPISLRSGIGAVGARTTSTDNSQSLAWFQIELEQDFPIDQIVLVPVIRRDSSGGPKAEGFPIDFRVIVGSEGDSEGTVIASYTEADGLLPRIAPLVLPCHSTVASWVRVEATRLSPRLWDSTFVLQLSEVLVFSGRENVALNRNVKMSSEDKNPGGERGRRYLVDGSVPYLLDAMEGERSIAFVKRLRARFRPILTIDLGAAFPLNQAHLHAVEVGDTIPQARRNGYGMPRKVSVVGANQADFSDAVELFALAKETIFEPVVRQRFPETTCRYVRFNVLEPDRRTWGDNSAAALGFAEIELYSKSENVALGKPFTANFRVTNRDRPFSAITDGRNSYGDIPPMQSWLEELAQRHDLEGERPAVVAKLSRAYTRQSSRLAWVTWLSLLLAFGIGAAILIGRTVRKRQLARLRERFAADLHDELGANIHVIRMLGDLAQKTSNSPEKLDGLLQEIRDMTDRSGHALQHCTNMLNADEQYQNLVENMQRTTKRIMADITGEFSFDGDKEILTGLKPRTQADLFLFYKECLVNISRHSKATEFSTKLSATSNGVRLVVNDNGQGPSLVGKNVPPSLSRRAQLLGGRVTAQRNEQGGTCITLKLKLRNWLSRK